MADGRYEINWNEALLKKLQKRFMVTKQTEETEAAETTEVSAVSY